jgi:hypothetical protein
MQITSFKMPSIKNKAEVVLQKQIFDTTSITLVFQKIFRSSNIKLDVYLDGVSEVTKIVSGKILQKDSILYVPNTNSDFKYFISCSNMDFLDEDITENTLQDFYLQFTDYTDGETWEVSEV